MTQGSPRFRNSWTHREGTVPAQVVQGKVVNVNLVTWTVDVFSQFDQKWYRDIQVGSPYLHPNNGEGQSTLPEVGAKCFVCLPSDSTPPFVMAFVMPLESVDLASPEAPSGTTSHASPGAGTGGASFAGGRRRTTPGGFHWETRDGNFLTLHRGGVLQLGANELAQRLYLPLQSHVMDVSHNYSHHNAGGSVQWLVGEGPDGKQPAQYGHTFRVYADSEFADVRVRCGKVSGLGEPPGEGGNQAEIDAEGLGGDTILYEVVVAKDGFHPATGDVASASTAKESVFRFFFDRSGGVFLRCKGSLVVSTKKKFTLRAALGIEMETGGQFEVKANGVILDGGPSVELKGAVVRIAKGTKPAAHIGSLVQVTLPFTPLPDPAVPVPMVVTGIVLTGDPRCLVGAG